MTALLATLLAGPALAQDQPSALPEHAPVEAQAPHASEDGPTWRFRGSLMSAPSFEDSGIFLLGDATLSRRGPNGLRLDARVSPGFLAITSAGVQTSETLTGFLIYDHEYFAVGVGGGVNLGARFDVGLSPVYSQYLRIGPQDRFNFELTNQFAYSIVHDWWDVDSIDASFQIPMSRQTQLVIRGMGGYGVGAGTVGVRVDASGTGEGNAWFTPYIGGAGGFFEGARGWRHDTYVSGPVVGLAFDKTF